MNKKNLLKLADAIARHRNVKVDRLAKRGKDMLVVWFCENASDLMTWPTHPVLIAAMASLNLPPVQPPPRSEPVLAPLVPIDQPAHLNIEEEEMFQIGWG
jgi:hypothetical protein